jgi:selenocysteine lyase/cysteine desulfurase
LLDAGIRAWSGGHAQPGDHGSLLRLATHVYNDHEDVEVLAGEIGALLAESSALR